MIGPPGVGKTELAKTTSEMFELPLIRLQCYEGLDEAKALYEWKYGKQLLYTQVLKETLDEVLQGAKGFAESEAKAVKAGLEAGWKELRKTYESVRGPNKGG